MKIKQKYLLTLAIDLTGDKAHLYTVSTCAFLRMLNILSNLQNATVCMYWHHILYVFRDAFNKI
jgi:hypothetical protein